jgi:hypothetical protein
MTWKIISPDVSCLMLYDVCVRTPPEALEAYGRWMQFGVVSSLPQKLVYRCTRDGTCHATLVQGNRFPA